jgi:hypothetical protein
LRYLRRREDVPTNDDPRIIEGKRELNFSDLKPDAHGSVSYARESGQMVAHSIKVSPKQAAKNTH